MVGSIVIAICSVLLARGMTVLPLALLVAAAEGAETYAAARRESWLAGTPEMRAPRLAEPGRDSIVSGEPRARWRSSPCRSSPFAGLPFNLVC